MQNRLYLSTVERGVHVVELIADRSAKSFQRGSRDALSDRGSRPFLDAFQKQTASAYPLRRKWPHFLRMRTNICHDFVAFLLPAQ
jgi:hypothetical protein